VHRLTGNFLLEKQRGEVKRVAILTRRHERDDVVREDVVDDRERWGGPPLVRALFTLAAAAAAGFLLWLAQLLDLTSTNEFWAAMGIVAGAGLVLGISQLLGGWTKWGMPVLSPGVFLFAWVPTAIVVGWILMVNQPEGGWYQEKLQSWSASLGIEGFVRDLGLWRAVLAFGLGIVTAFTFDTTGPRERRRAEYEREVVPDEDVHDYDTTATTGERAVVRDDRTMAATGDRVDVRDPERRDLR
jgi:hypothetical protein